MGDWEMKLQPNKNYKSNDEIMTPEYLAEALVNHFKPSGKILEPCKGTGNFLKLLPKDTLWCEISEGKNFFDFNEKVDWIITNPPWSQIRKFLQHSLEISKNVCFLLTINHLWTKARIRDIKEAGFGIREIIIFDTPDNFPPLGFQVGMIHLQDEYSGNIIFSDLSGLIETKANHMDLSLNKDFKEVSKLKQPKIVEETEKFIEFEIPEGKAEDYNLPEGCFKYGDGQDFSSPPKFYEYWIFNKEVTKEESLKFLKEKYKIALQIKDYERAKKFLLKIKEYENE